MYNMEYLILVFLPGLVLGGIATLITKTTFNKYSKVASSRRHTGAEAARQLLDRQGLHDVNIEMTQGFLSDHYDPRVRKLRLSPQVYQSNSLSAIGVACHEAGHALQHAQAYAPLKMRSALVPISQFGSNAAYFILMAGWFLGNMPQLYLLGAILFAAVVLFSLVTLPVEWDASARAKRLMVSSGIVSESEQASAAKVLNAAFLTYVASTVTAILTLVYFLLRARR